MDFVIRINKFFLVISPVLVCLGYFKISPIFLFMPLTAGLVLHMLISLFFIVVFMMNMIILTFVTSRQRFLLKFERPILTLPLISGSYWHTAFFSIVGMREDFIPMFYFLYIAAAFTFFSGVFAYYFFSLFYFLLRPLSD